MTILPIRGPTGLDVLHLESRDGARADVHLHGAQPTSWIPAGSRDDRLYLSSRATFGDGSPIRGGIPVSFPQFAKQGPLPNHGFARTRAWQLVEAAVDAEGRATAHLALRESPETLALWPHAFALDFRVRIGGATLEVELAVSNTGPSAFEFTAALHTYFRVDSAAATRVLGLRGVAYRDKLSGADPVVADEPELRIDRALDRVYAGAPPLELLEPARALSIRAVGFPDTVVWNPGAAASELADVARGDELRFVCVEAAAARRPVTLAPAARWVGSQILTVRAVR